MSIRIVSTLAAVVLVAGCSKPTDTVIPSDMSKWDTELAPAAKKLPEEDRKLLGAFVMRAKVGQAFGKGEGIPFGMTIGEAIAEQKKWADEQRLKAAEEQALKERLAKEALEAQKRINEAVTVALLSKKQLRSDYRVGRYQDEQLFVVGIENKSNKKIIGVSGEIDFIDVFDKTVASTNFAASESIAPGASIKWTGSRKYNEFISEQQAMWNLEEGKYTTKFTPWEVIFEGGEKLSAPR